MFIEPREYYTLVIKPLEQLIKESPMLCTIQAKPDCKYITIKKPDGSESTSETLYNWVETGKVSIYGNTLRNYFPIFQEICSEILNKTGKVVYKNSITNLKLKTPRTL